MKTYANVILNLCTTCIFVQLIHAENWEQAKKLFWSEHKRKYFRLLSTLEVPEEAHPEFRLNDLRQFENK